ncbi:hypothetical protein [Pseudomonas protegens]|nr:hypothetical protein [Pseudomonas protegens]
MNNFTDYRLPSLDALLAFQAAAQLQSFERAAAWKASRASREGSR